MDNNGGQPKLKPFQEREITPLLLRKRGGITWDMGLGKTAAAATIGARSDLLRWLIICPDNAFSVWRDEAPRWIQAVHPYVPVRVDFIVGSAEVRELSWNAPYDPHCVQLKVCTIDCFLRDWGDVVKVGRKTYVRLKQRQGFHVPEIVIYDEARRIRNRKTQAFQCLKAWMTHYTPPYFFPMTGTPGHEPKHFWTMLHLIDPRLFRSYWTFVRTFHEVDDIGFGVEVNEPKNLTGWYQLLRRYFSIVREEEVATERPPLTRQLLEIQMDEDQQQLYNDLKLEWLHYVSEDQKVVVAQNDFTLLTRLRQTLVCPKLLSPSLGVGQAIKDFAETVEPEQHNVIFSPYPSAFEHFEAYLRSKGFKNVYRLQGGMGTPERDGQLLSYRSTGGTILCSILYAQAFSLEPATKCFFIGYDWDPDHNRQAEKRLHRLTTLNPIMCYYYTFRSSFDSQIAYVVNIKQQHVNITIPENLNLIA